MEWVMETTVATRLPPWRFVIVPNAELWSTGPANVGTRDNACSTKATFILNRTKLDSDRIRIASLPNMVKDFLPDYAFGTEGLAEHFRFRTIFR